MDAAEKLGNEVGVHQACQSLGVSRASFYRRRRQKEALTTEREPRRSVRALSAKEREQVRGALNSDRFMDKAPREVYATLLDEGEYLCSVRTMYRILNEEKAVRERRNQLAHPNYKKPQLLATRPNQVWSWDITKLLGPKKWSYYYLYVILDIYSRYVVGWMLAHREAASLASRLIRETVENQEVCEDQLTIHSDRGPSMASQSVAQLLASLGVVKSHSRPHVSNDNPFSESQFKTMKYRPEFPNRFGGYEDALGYCRPFFTWYNDEHYHSGIGLMTPAMLHYGGAEQVVKERAHVLQHAYEAHPERFVRGCPKPQPLPTAAWINPPVPTNKLARDNDPSLVEIQTPSELIRSKRDLGSSPLPNGETSTRFQIPNRIEQTLNQPAHEKRLPEIDCPQKPDAPLTHPRPGYPLLGCVPAEPNSVSPGAAQTNVSNVELQPPLNTRAMPQKIPGVWGLAPRGAVKTMAKEKTLH
jgi:putative transposase